MQTTHSPTPSVWRILAIVLGLLSAAFMISAPSFAQEAAAEAEAPAEPGFPAGLDALDGDFEQFQLRLIPLTVDELSALAAAWQQIVRGQTDVVIEATITAQNSSADPAAAATQIEESTALRSQGFKRFSAVISNLEKKGGDEAEIATYRAYRSAIIVEEKQRADWTTLSRQALAWAVSPEGGLQVALDTGVVLGALIGIVIVARFLRGYVRRLFSRVPNLSKLLQSFLVMVVYWITIAVGLMVVLSALGLDITPVFALVGGASFILAFAMQDTLSNLASGLMIMINHPFDEGDYVSAGGTAGTVKSVSIVSTTITTPDNQVIVIPNSKVWGDVITNATVSDRRRVDLVFGIDYDDDADKAMAVILEVAQADPRVLGDPAPWVRVTNLGESSVDLTTRLWCHAGDYWELKFAVMKDVKKAFDQNGISIPYPHSVEIQKAV